MQRSLLTAVLLSSLAAADASAQRAPEPIFSELTGAMATAAAAASLQPAGSAVAERRAVGMRLDRLFDNTTPLVLLNIAGHSWVAHFDRLDTNVLGHRAWVGSIEGIEYSHVSFAEHDGVVSGLVDAVSETHQIRTIGPGLYSLERLDGSRSPRVELEPLVDNGPADGAPPATAAGAVQDGAGTIDVLILYTPNARTRAGGVAQVQTLVSRIISDSNSAFLRSGVSPRLRLVGTSEIALTEAASMSADLSAVTNSATARGLRDSFRADLVQLLVNSPDTSACGVAWLLRSLGSTTFYAYSVADVDCAFQYTPTHEMGHNMGSHHAPEDSASGALFPYSYGYKDPARGFRTVMAYSCSGVSCPRVLNMSNASVLQGGFPTGSSTQNNALSLNNAATTVANFRQAATTPPPPTVTPPSAPTGLLSQVNGTNVTLSWNGVTTDWNLNWAPSAATGYTLQVGSATGLANFFNRPVGNVTSVSGSVPLGTYYWRVVASNAAGAGPASAEAQFTVGSACVAPGAPQNFSFTLAGRALTLTWVAPVAGTPPITYIVDVGSATGLSNLLTVPTGSNATILAAQAPPGMFFVRVRAQNACGTSAASNERVIAVP